MPTSLTPAQLAALEYASRNSRVRLGSFEGDDHERAVRKRELVALARLGLLCRVPRLTRGLDWYVLTDAGRAALEEAEHG